MAYLIDKLIDTRRQINGSWWIARPDVPSLLVRIAGAWQVLTGKADAVVFRENLDEKAVNGLVKN